MASRASGRYSGASGARYFAWQDRAARAVGAIEARKFQPYVGPADTVVDFGCGGGHILAALRCRMRIGVEVNPDARAQAEAQGIRTVPSTSELVANSADAVISHHALEHTLDPLGELHS